MSKTELKDLVISRAKVDTKWVRGSHEGLEPHEFNLDAGFLSSCLLPGGKFVVVLYKSGALSLKEIQELDAGEWNLVDVARCERENYGLFWSKLLTETSHGCPTLACMNEAHDKYVHFMGKAHFRLS